MEQEEILANSISKKGLYTKHMKTSATEQYQIGQRTHKDIFFQERHRNGFYDYKKIFNTTSYEGNIKKNLPEISSYIYYGGHYLRKTLLLRMQRRWNPYRTAYIAIRQLFTSYRQKYPMTQKSFFLLFILK